MKRRGPSEPCCLSSTNDNDEKSVQRFFPSKCNAIRLRKKKDEGKTESLEK